MGLPIGVLIAALGAACAARAEAAVPPYRVPEPVVRRLDNGLTVAVFRDERLPLVHVELAVRAGSAVEAPSQVGVAHCVTELVGHATTSRDENALRVDLARAGGGLTTQLGRDLAIVSGTFLAREIPAALEVTSDAVINAVFTQDDMTRVVKATQMAMERSAQSGRQGEETLWSLVFGTGGYGHPLTGTPETLASLKLADVRDFYHAHWTPGNTVLVMAGDVSVARAQALAREWFGRWTTGPVGAEVPPAPPFKRAARIVDRPQAERSQVFVGAPAPPAGHADEIPTALAVQLVTRDPGSIPTLAGGETSLREGGLLWLTASASNDSAGIVARALEARLLALRDTPPPPAALGELERAVTLAFPMRFETLEGLAAQWSADQALKDSTVRLDAFQRRVAAVTPETMTAAVRRWIDRERIGIVLVGPQDRLAPQLQGLAPETSTGPDRATVAEAERHGRDIVQHAIAAHGGLDKLRGIRDSELEADMTIPLNRQPVTGQLTQVRKEPYRMVLVTHLGEVGARQVLNDDRAWTTPIDSAWISRDADPMAIAALRQGFRSDVPHVLIDAADPATKLQAAGTDTLDGQTCEKVEAWLSGGVRRTMYFDPKTGRLVGIEQREPGRLPGEDVMARRVYRDHREVSGILIPFAEDRWLGGRRAMELRYTRVAFNTGVPDATFERTAPLPPPSR